MAPNFRPPHNRIYMSHGRHEDFIWKPKVSSFFCTNFEYHVTLQNDFVVGYVGVKASTMAQKLLKMDQNRPKTAVLAYFQLFGPHFGRFHPHISCHKIILKCRMVLKVGANERGDLGLSNETFVTTTRHVYTITRRSEIWSHILQKNRLILGEVKKKSPGGS